jgi:RNA-binding protein 39
MLNPAAAAVPGVLNPGGDLSLQQGLLGPASPIPTQCLLLKNMFDASQQTEPNWVNEVAEDVREECSKFGAVLHVHVDKSSQVRVFLE